MLTALDDPDLLNAQRMVGTAARKNWALRDAVTAAVHRRRHRGAWPIEGVR
ncbi:MAG: hypothetical protein ACRDRH_28890 [Pseudonocardia sp.]